MSDFRIMPIAACCPVCGSRPSIEECGPRPRGCPPLGWRAGCYSVIPEEHYIGVNADTRLDAVRQWNQEVAKIEVGDFETARTR